MNSTSSIFDTQAMEARDVMSIAPHRWPLPLTPLPEPMGGAKSEVEARRRLLKLANCYGIRETALAG